MIPQLIGSLHRPFCLLIRLQVAPLSRSSVSARVSASGFPVTAPFLLNRRPMPQVAPWLRSFGCAGDLHSSCPELGFLRRCWFQRGSELPPWLTPPPCSACDGGLGLPLVLHLRLYRRWIVESPRFSHLSAVPVVKAPGCPFALRLRYRRRSVFGSPRMLILRHRLMGSPSHLGSCTIRFALVDLPGRPGFSPSATTINQFPSRPESRVFRRSPIPFHSSRPELRFLG